MLLCECYLVSAVFEQLLQILDSAVVLLKLYLIEQLTQRGNLLQVVFHYYWVLTDAASEELLQGLKSTFILDRDV